MEKDNTQITSYELNLLIDKADEEMRKVIVLMSKAGLRLNETCAIKFKDISLNSIHVCSEMELSIYGWRQSPIMHPRYISAFPPELLGIIGMGEPNQNIITHNPNEIRNKFHKLKKSLGLECNIHDLRKYYSRNLIVKE